MRRQNEELIAKLSVPPEGHEALHFEHAYPQSSYTQFKLILWKFWMSYWRNPTYNGTRFIFALGLSLLIGTILWDVGSSKCAANLPCPPSSPVSSQENLGPPSFA